MCMRSAPSPRAPRADRSLRSSSRTAQSRSRSSWAPRVLPAAAVTRTAARGGTSRPGDVADAVTPKELEPTDVAAVHTTLDEAAYAAAARDAVGETAPAPVTILEGDALELLRTMPAESVDCAYTSPPYFGLRAYGGPSTLGCEATLAEYVDNLITILRELRRVLSGPAPCG